MPTATYSLTFDSSPCPSGSTCNYGWESVSSSDNSVQQGKHTGMLVLNMNGAVGQWADMGQTSGGLSVSSTAFPQIGGTAGGATGWSFEVVVKPGPVQNWGKLFDIGSSRPTTALGSCVNDIAMSWDAANAQWQLDVCDPSNNQYQTGDAFGIIQPGVWYHLVAVITPTTGSLANYLTYVNGQLYTAEASFYYPTNVARQNAWLGRSGWWANGDANFSGEVDLFNVYNVALNDVQIANRAASLISTTPASSCTAKPSCSSNPAAVPAAWYNLTFATNPVASYSTATYTWQQSASSDSGCAYTHTGLASFAGGTSSSGGQYLDLNYATGANSSGTKIPGTIGGAGSGSLTDGTMGWSFEFTFLSGQEAVNGKIFAMGAGQAVWNIFAGPDGSGTGSNFGVYGGAGNYNNGGSGIIEFANPVYTTQWYHVVAVVQQVTASSTNPTHGAYFLYVNGQLLNYTGVGVYMNSLLVQAQARPFSYLAKSDWSADPYWTGAIDTFRIYDRALTQTQVTTLYQGEMGGCSVPTQSSTISGVTSAPNLTPRTSTALVTPLYSLTFDTDPRTTSGLTYNYGWEKNLTHRQRRHPGAAQRHCDARRSEPVDRP